MYVEVVVDREVFGVYEYTHDIVSVICMFAMSSGCR